MRVRYNFQKRISVVVISMLLIISLSFFINVESVTASGEAPLISNPSPENTSINQTLNPLLSITVNDPEGNNMSIMFLSNASGEINRTWYFDNYSFSNWTDHPSYPNSNLVDDNNNTCSASIGVHKRVFILDNNTCNISELGTIIKVELVARVGGTSEDGDWIIYRLVPIFNGTSGDIHNLTWNLSDETTWISCDITNDSNAPASWRWSDISDLDCEFWDWEHDVVNKMSGRGYRVGVRVTYNWEVIGLNLSVTNGTYIQLPTIMNEYNTTYYWSVKATDGTTWTNKTYHFTTMNNTLAVITNGASGVEETNATLCGYLQGGLSQNFSVWFDYGTNESYGYQTANETISGGETFNYNLGGTATLFEYYEDGNTDGITIYGNWCGGQTFNLGSVGQNLSHYVGRVGLKIRKIGNPESFFVGIKATTAGELPTGDYLAQTTVDASQIGDMDWYNIDFTTPYQLTAGSKYALILSCPTGNSGNYINWAYESLSASYPGGNRIWSTNGGSSWNHDTSVDLSFREFELIPLSSGILYHYRAVANNSIDTIYGSDEIFLTKPQEPTSLIAQTNSSSVIYVNWTKGVGANKTYIERYNSSNWARGTGTEIYNGTGTSYEDTGLTEITTYYYQAWSYASWGSLYKWSDSNTSSNNTTEYPPLTVVTNASTGMEETNTTLRGYLQQHGGENCTVRFEYGINTSYGTNTSNQTKTRGDTFNVNISNLTKGQLYHFRTYANNSADSTTGSDKIFLTKPDEPTNLTAIAVSSGQINLAWNKGTGTNNTYIRRKTGSYPTSVTDGTQVYNGTGTSFSNTGLSASTTYYYRAWSYVSWDSLNQRSDSYVSASATTGSGGGGGGVYIPPTSDEGRSLTVREQVERLYNITLNKNFYTNDTDKDGVLELDEFGDPNGILSAERIINISGNSTFLISVNKSKENVFLWDTKADSITLVTYNLGNTSDPITDPKNKTITITVRIEKADWTYFEIADPYPDNSNLTVKTSDRRTISSDRIWRENGNIYVLDDPAIEYIFTFFHQSRNFLFDVILELTKDSVTIGGSFEALITLINVGDPGLVNATLNYTLYKEGKIIWTEKEDISFSGQLAFNKTISTEGLDAGEYTLEIVHYYGDNQTASAHSTFIVNDEEAVEESPIWIYVIFVIIIIALLIFFYWFFKVKKSDTNDLDDIGRKIDERYEELLKKSK